MSKRICPYCYKPFSLSNIEFRCANPKCKLERDEKETALWGTDRILHVVAPAKKRLFGLIKPKYGVCPLCGQKAYKPICPECHNLIPAPMLKEGGRIISIIGAQSAGKTVYVSILIEELMKYGRMLGGFGVTPTSIADDPKESTKNRYINELWGPIYKRHVLPSPTDPEKVFIPPLIFELEKNEKGKPSVFLVFYDNAGENFSDATRVEQYADYITNSDAFICLIDVLQIDNIRNKINYNDPNYEVHDRDFGFVADKIREYCTSGQGQRNKSILDKPFAVVFNKFDYVYNNPSRFNLQDISGIGKNRTNSYFLQSGAAGVKLDDLTIVHEGIKTFLDQECMPQASNFLASIKSFSNHKFFGVSPLGGAPVEEEVANLNPFRVLDPLLWILNELKYGLNVV